MGTGVIECFLGMIRDTDVKIRLLKEPSRVDIGVALAVVCSA